MNANWLPLPSHKVNGLVTLNEGERERGGSKFGQKSLLKRIYMYVYHGSINIFIIIIIIHFLYLFYNFKKYAFPLTWVAPSPSFG